MVTVDAAAAAALSALTTAAIIELDSEGKMKIPMGITPILFNPSQISTQRGINRAEQPKAGTGKTEVQASYTETSSLSMELFFDTTDEKVPVTLLTDRVESLLVPRGESHDHATCRFVWGAFMSFDGHLVGANTTYTMFLPTGIPVRARMNVTFKETDRWALRQKNPLESADRTTVRRVTAGDTLWSIAADEYGDPTRWQPIAAANDIENPRLLEPGVELTVPALGPEGS